MSGNCTGPHSARNRDELAAVASGLQAGVEDELRLERDVAPGRVEFTRRDDLREVALPFHFLRSWRSLAVFPDREAARMAFHVKEAARDAEEWLVDLEGGFGAVEGEDEILQRHRTLGAADVGPLLVLGAKRTVERRADA